MSPASMKQQYLRGVGLTAIADKSKHSIGYVRKQLTAQRVKIRSAGRPAGAKKVKKAKKK